MHGAKTAPVHQFTLEEWIAEGRDPALFEAPKPEAPSGKGVAFDSYIPWYLRDHFMLLRIADGDPVRADLLARSLRYDEIIELRWLKNSKDKALNDNG